MNGAFPNMNFGGDFNQMQMMMAMQNGMAPNFGAFPMMGKHKHVIALTRRPQTDGAMQECQEWAWTLR